MNLLRVRIDHGDILTFILRQRFTRWWYGQCGIAIDDFLWLNGCHDSDTQNTRTKRAYGQPSEQLFP